METKDLIVTRGRHQRCRYRDAAGRGLSVLMLEARSACATSSASSEADSRRLRYLEHYEFRPVSEALAEREVLLKMAPHLAFSMRFACRIARTCARPDDPYRSVYVRSPRNAPAYPVRPACDLAQNRY